MMCFGCFFAIISLIFMSTILLKIYLKFTTGWCYSKKCLLGKTVLVTGANIGLGYETARDFAMRGARVILACRDPQKAEEAKKKIIEDTGNSNIVVKIVDMVSFDSVRKLANEIHFTEASLNILVNNAGIGPGGPKYTKEGNVYLYQVNYFSHFLLTVLLIDLLKKSKGSRIVNVSSRGAMRGHFDVHKLGEFPETAIKADANSKLFQILFTKELGKRLRGNEITIFSVNPGAVRTDIHRKMEMHTILRIILHFLAKLFFKNCIEGVQTTLYASLQKGLEKYSGKHFSDCKLVEYGSARVDSNGLKVLWEKSEQVVGLTSEEKRTLTEKHTLAKLL